MNENIREQVIGNTSSYNNLIVINKISLKLKIMINIKGTRVDGLLQVDWSDEVASKI